MRQNLENSRERIYNKVHRTFDRYELDHTHSLFQKKDLLLHDINLDEGQPPSEDFFLTDGDYLPNIHQRDPVIKVSNTQSRIKMKLLDTVQFPIDYNYNRYGNESILHKKKRISQLGNPTKKYLNSSKSAQKLD